ncbi:MAG: tyrosine-type recombinase/integrase [Verrucomicrobiales bacterium]
MASLRRIPGTRYWIACFRLPSGKRTQRSTKVVADGKPSSRRQAIKIAEQYEDEFRRFQTAEHAQQVLREIYEEVTGANLPKQTTRTYFAAWLKEKEPETSDTTSKFYVSKSNSFLTFLGERADSDIATISEADLLAYRGAESKRVSASTVNHSIKFLRMVFRSAKKDGLISANPAEHVGLVKRTEPKTRRAFTVDELKQVLSVCDDEWRSMVLFGFYTGQRLADVSKLTWRDIDLEAGEIRLTTMKTTRQQKIPIASPLAKHIKSLGPRRNDEPVHPRAFGVLEKQGRSGMLSRQFRSLLAQVGLAEKMSHKKGSAGQGREGRHQMNPLSFHSLRHTATSIMKNAGVASSIVEEFVGHDSPEMNRIYTHIDTESMGRAAETLPDIVSLGYSVS